ncbi:Paxillin [Folsomia candida]|uniref:Paxillin n=1 Tax=Folsomia candida TaxID=158441 RepID=A0A226DXK6_FOLCA|nr:Paxillin [Folsomia candida]
MPAKNMDVIDVLGDLLIDLEKTAASTSSPRAREQDQIQKSYAPSRPLPSNSNMNNLNSNFNSSNKLLVIPPSVEPSFLYAPDKDIITGLPLVRTASPAQMSPRIMSSPRPGSALSNVALDPDETPSFSVNDGNQDFKFQSYHLDYKYTPPPIKGPCCVCGDGIMGAMVTALDKMWHPEHFLCVHCGIELRSPMYLEHDGQPYCKVCHGKLFLPPCAGCGKDITGNYIKAMEKIWHPPCFQCTRCRKVLTPTTFFPKEGKPYCEDDFHDLFSPKCWGCKKPIKDDRKISVLGRHWHPEHFKCCECGIQLNPNNFKEKNGKLYCEKDFNNLFMPKCGGCNTPVVSNGLTAMGKTWHPHCFNCTECKKQLNPDRFFEKNGLPYCEDDFHKLFSPKCAGCRQPIKDQNKMINAMCKPWHPNHFTCTECSKVLTPENFFEKNGLPYCEDDFHKLFSPKCAGCQRPIKDPKKVLNVMGKQFHPEHFNCTECGKILQPDNYFEKNGLPYCEDDFHKLFSAKCAGCGGPIKDKYVFAMGKYFHPHHFTCSECGKQLKENEFMEKDGRIYCMDDFLNLFAPKCVACRKPIKEEYCLVALEGDWHSNCFRCKDCNCLLEDRNFFEIDGEPYCEQHFHARQCPDCVKIRREQNRYFGISITTPMGPSRWASQVSLKSLIEDETITTTTTKGGVNNSSNFLVDDGGRPNSALSYTIPIEREGGRTYRNGGFENGGHVHGETCNHSHEEYQTQSQRSSLKRGQQLGQSEQKLNNGSSSSSNMGKWSGSQNNLQYIARNENPYNYLEQGKFPVESKHIRFSDTVTQREFEKDGKYY